MYLCVINWLTDTVPELSVERSEEKSEEPEELKATITEPVSTAPPQAAEPLQYTDQSSEVPPESVEHPEQTSEPIQLTTEVLPVPPESMEPGAVGDEAALPADLSVTPAVDLREDAAVSDDPDARGVRIYTDTTEGVPQVERDVQETEEVLPDGTVVRRQVVRTSQRQTISTRVVMEGPEDILPASKAEAEQLLGKMGVAEELGQQMVATSDSEPQASTNVEEHEEVLPDGSIVKRRVVTTTKQHVTTERVSLEDDDIPAGTVVLHVDDR